jgi:NADH-quinone oxidoreductase subunit G
MSEAQAPEPITIFIDDQPVAVPPGTNLVEAATLAGREIPHYCYHPHLSVTGNCRMCLVETGMPARDRASGQPILEADGNPRIQWGPKPVIGCATAASPGMHVRTDSALVKSCREGVMEFLLVNHPLDCPICDKAGECRLQEFATDYGRGHSRFVEQKNVKPKRTRIGPRVILDDERCILCSRCIRFCAEIAKDPVLGFTDRGSYTTLTTFPGRELANNYSLNTVDICPVGALTSTDFRFRMRVWFLRATDSIDSESSTGCNTVVHSREGVIHRITPRRNDAVNDSWMPDSGRLLYQQVDAEDRLSAYAIDGRPCAPEEALTLAATLLRNGQAAIVGSGRLSVEEQFLLRRLAAAVPGDTPVWLVARTGAGDGLLLSADRNPNVRGALLTGLIDRLPGAEVDALVAAVQAGTVRTILCVGEDLAAAGMPVEMIKRIEVAYIGVQHCMTSQYAKIEMPLLTVFEKAGSFVNQQFRLQKFAQAIPGPVGVLPGLSTFTRLLAAVGGSIADADADPTARVPPTSDADPTADPTARVPPTSDADPTADPTARVPPAADPADDLTVVWRALAAQVPEFAGLSHATIPATGVPLAAGRFAGLPFVEGPSLHFQPRRSGAES